MLLKSIDKATVKIFTFYNKRYVHIISQIAKLLVFYKEVSIINWSKKKSQWNSNLQFTIKFAAVEHLNCYNELSSNLDEIAV